MDASQYKDYILTLLFVKYVSDKAKSDPGSLIDVPDGGSFDDMIALKGDKEIGDKINKIIAKLAGANGLQKVIDQADFNDEEKLGKGKEMQDRLSKLVAIFADLDFRGSRAEGDDLLGDAYEYLMRHFATESGKSKGQFYTPAEVSRILAKVVGIDNTTRQDHTVYDPTCGSGSLLLKAAAEAPRGMTIYGQEKDNATWALSKMNMILHGNEIADIRKGDTITNPQFTQGSQLKTFDFVVMNPPFSTKSWSNGLENDFGRFEFGIPPARNGDYAFLLHAFKSLKSTGKAAVILPHGVLFRGNAEAMIRKAMLQRGYIKGVIGLPPNLFYGTGIPACIMILDKEDAQARSGVFMIDASREFMKDGAKNRLRSQDIHKIVDVFTRKIEIDRYSRMVPISEIADLKNDFNLNIPRYIDSSEPEDVQDLHAHLRGGIPESDIDALGPYWDSFPSLRSELLVDDRPGYVRLAVTTADVHQMILDCPDFARLGADVGEIVEDWLTAHRPSLRALSKDTRPSDLIETISENLLSRFKGHSLLDPYDVYEQLMTYWHLTMHDDIYMIMKDGWVQSARPRATIDDKSRKLSEDPDLIVGSGRKRLKYKMDLVPPALVVRRFFAADREQVDELEAEAERVGQALTDFIEEQGTDEEGWIAYAADEKGKLTQKAVNAALKEAKLAEDDQGVEVLESALDLVKAEAAAKKSAREARTELDRRTLQKYGDLGEEEVQSLVVDDKWAEAIRLRTSGVVKAVTSVLAGRVRILGERYAETVGQIDRDLSELEARVEDHLAQMGIEP